MKRVNIFLLGLVSLSLLFMQISHAAEYAYVVSYFEAMPAEKEKAADMAQRLARLSRKDAGSVRFEVLQRIGHPDQFVVLEVWKDQKTFEANGKSANAAQLREKINAIRNAPSDQRVHIPVSVGPLQAGPGGDAVYVVTHVDVIPPRKDDGLAAVKQLGEDGRKEAGNARFEVVQQTNRPNHFTVVEIWKDAKAVDAHSMTEAWFLADAEGFADYFGVSAAKVPANPESLAHGKQSLLSLCRESYSRDIREEVVAADGGAGPLFVDHLNEFAATRWDVEAASERSDGGTGLPGRTSARSPVRRMISRP